MNTLLLLWKLFDFDLIVNWVETLPVIVLKIGHGFEIRRHERYKPMGVAGLKLTFYKVK